MLRTQLRFFSQSRVACGQVKRLVKRASDAEDPTEIMRLAKEASLKASRKKAVPKKRKPETALTRQHAAHILTQLTGEEVDMNKIGPLSNDDVKYFQVATKPVLYTLLGISENQLLDSVVVDTTVRRFLARSQIEKALMVAKLAGSKGSVAMNNIMKWQLEQGKLNDALDLYTWRKKWKVPVTNPTLTILFDGFSKYRKNGTAGLTTLQVKKLQSIFMDLKKSYFLKPNMSHINSAFSAMMNCQDQRPALETFEKFVNKEIPNLATRKPNAQTYTIMLKRLHLPEDETWAYEVGSKLVQSALKLPKDMRDRELYESCVFVFLRSKNPVIAAKAFTLIPLMFHVPKLTAKFPEMEIKSQNFEGLALKKKYYPSIALIDTMAKRAMQLGDPKTSYELVEYFFDEFPKSVDVAFFNRYLQVIGESCKSEAGDLSLTLYDLIQKETNYKHIQPTHITRLRVLLNIYAQSLKNLTHEGRLVVGKTSQKLFEMADGFIEKIGGDVTLYEIYGYTKAIRKLALTPEQRTTVISRIEDAKANFDRDIKTLPGQKSEHRSYVEKILVAEKRIKQKHELKPLLKEMDKKKKLQEKEEVVEATQD